MESVKEFVEKQATSIFSNNTVSPLPSGVLANQISIIVVCIIFGAIGYFYYMFPEKSKTLIGSILLYFHMDKPNEIHTTQIPEDSNVNSLLSTLGLNESLQSF